MYTVFLVILICAVTLSYAQLRGESQRSNVDMTRSMQDAKVPTASPTVSPSSSRPSKSPSSSLPTPAPSLRPSNEPTTSPSHSPTSSPTVNSTTYRPNVLLLILDDFKPIATSFGSPLVPGNGTRNIDMLVQDGISFMNAHAQMAICGPSRASFLTSLRPDALNIYNLNTENALGIKIARSKRTREILTLPKLFKVAGYNTYGIGKIFHENEYRLMQQSDQWTVPMYSWITKLKRPPSFTKPYVGTWISSPDVRDDYFSDGQAATLAATLLRDVLDRDFHKIGTPWFLAVGLWKPHLPWHAPKRYFDIAGDSTQYHGAFNLGRTTNLDASDFNLAKGNGCGEVSTYQGAPRKLAAGYASPEALRQSNRAYHANVMYNDVQIGIILDALHSSSSRDDTIIVFTSDHGFHLGDKGLYCKHTNFEAATKTPVVVVPAKRDPIRYQRGGKSYAPVELLDIMPTLFELARLENHVDLSIYKVWQGVSLMPILKDPENAYVKQMAVSQYFRNTGSAQIWGYSVRTTRYRYTGWDRKFEELYDYLQDEWETNSFQKNQALKNSLLNNAYYNARNFNAGRMKIPFDFADRTAMKDRPSSLFA